MSDNRNNHTAPVIDPFIGQHLHSWMGKLGLICEPDKEDELLLKGIAQENHVYSGPGTVHIDLTNRCNSSCIACWCHSPLIGPDALPASARKSTLSLKVVKELISDLASLTGVRYVKLTGGGEPSVHPHFLEIVKLVKMLLPATQLDIHTNLMRVDEHLAARLIDIGVDKFTVSLWAGTADAYVRTHPEQTRRTFDKIVHHLEFIKEHRREGKPIIELHNVVMNANCSDVQDMLKLAIKTGADAIVYTLVDPIAGKTDHLVLNREQRIELLQFFKKLRKACHLSEYYTDPHTGKVINIINLSELLKKLARPSAEKGMYDKSAVNLVPCYMGWAFTRIMADGSVVPCCKGHRMPMGNLNRHTFADIWHGKLYRRFRENGLKLDKRDRYYRRMGNALNKGSGCYNCDNLMDNLLIHRKILYRSGPYHQLIFEIMRNIKSMTGFPNAL